MSEYIHSFQYKMNQSELELECALYCMLLFTKYHVFMFMSEFEMSDLWMNRSDWIGSFKWIIWFNSQILKDSFKNQTDPVLNDELIIDSSLIISE